jgi:phosphohistidine phosphatase
MKTLFLVRHAKSSWADPALPDKERPLNGRGKRDAPAMGKRLAMRKVKADLIISSPARRALATAKIIAKGIDYKRGNIVIDDRLYPGAAAALLKIIHRIDKRVDRVMMVGHDPALMELARRLSKAITRMPTCAVAEFTFEAKSWLKVDKSTLATVRLERPRKS